MHPVAPPVEGQAWLTSEPVPWEALRGRAVIVVFWSYGCEASLVRVRQIEAIVGSTAHPLTAIAVHTPRFPFEEDVAGVRSAVTQHRIAIPVVHDPEYLTWNNYNPGGWPATIVIDARGRVLGGQAGTNDIDLIMNSVGLGLRSVATLTARGARRPLVDVPASTALPLPGTNLAFPTSLAVRPNGELVVADFGNSRLLVFEPSPDLHHAEAVAEIGGFDHPYGVLADDGDGLYVSEPSLGSVSYLDLAQRSRRLLTSELVAPTSLTDDSDGSVVVADSGGEKLYRLINRGAHSVTLGLIAGSGETGCRDGGAADAELAQPTGIARTEVGLVFCDAASSNIRLLTDSGKVATITGNGFFDWGLVDGPAHEARLQRPSDLAVLDDGSIVVVDTGNNRLRRLVSRRIRTLGLAGLNRPAGICRLPSGHLIVADTGNHRLVVVDRDLQTAWPLRLDGVLPPFVPHDGVEALGAVSPSG